MERSLKDFLLRPESYSHEVGTVEHLETHISDIFLAGDFAYKVKKAVKFDFLDFSSLERRRYFCEREVSLNQRFAPDLYHGVAAINRLSAGALSFDGAGETIEYAVRMRRLDRGGLFTELMEQGRLSSLLVTEVARKIAAFHQMAELASTYWSPSAVLKAVDENLAVLKKHSPGTVQSEVVVELANEVRERFERLKELIKNRQSTFVKALHGDLHLGNIALFGGKPTLFDGIEFSDELSSCDTWADLAFLIMDLIYRGGSDLANVVLNTYLEETGDFEGLALLNFYVSYRAAVRAKISCLKLDGDFEGSSRERIERSVQDHTALSLKALQIQRPIVFAIGGLSGSGKTTLSRLLAQECNAVHIRSDVIRKHLLGLELLKPAGERAYTPDVTDRTYAAMIERASIALKAGFSVVLDAVHSDAKQRKAVEDLAITHNIKFFGFWCAISRETATERVQNRVGDASDADVAIVQQQFSRPIPIHGWYEISTEGESKAALNLVRARAALKNP